jgi:hypothetical protein
MASNSKEYELTCFGKCLNKCSIVAKQGIIVLFYTVLIIALGGTTLVLEELE